MNIKKKKAWYIYIIECADGTYYTGITTDTERRIAEHNTSGIKGARYTRERRPVKLVYSEKVSGRTEALKRESQIKKMSRAVKEKLVSS